MTRPRDTSTEAYARQIDAVRRLAPVERLAAAAAMSEEIRTLVAAGVRRRHPEYTAEEVGAAVTELPLGVDLAARVRRDRLRRGKDSPNGV